MEKTIRLTTAQAIVKFLDNQYVCMDGEETKFVEDFFTIFGHGIAVGLGEALDRNPGGIHVMQGRNEQGMCHTATAFAKQNDRKKIIPCAASVGPGSANSRYIRFQTARSRSAAARAVQQPCNDHKRCFQARS